MKNFKILVISILPIMWTIYFLFELFTGRIDNSSIFIGNLILILLFALIGYTIYSLSLSFNIGFNKKNLFIIFLILMLLDQGSKIIIKFFYFNNNITLIKNFLYFNPIINTDGSWLNARFGTGISFHLLIITNFIALFLFIEVYRYYISKNKKDFWCDMCFIFMFSGALCSLIDKVFYGGSLDFIGIGDLFIADIKDIYINLGILFFIALMLNSGALTSEDSSSFKEDIQSIKRFFNFIKSDIKTVFKNKKDL